MKKVLVCFALVFMSVFMLCEVSLAKNGPFEKISRGAVNIISGPLELGKAVTEKTEEGGFIEGIVYGGFAGIGEAIRRTGIGIYEVVTFPFPLPKNYEPIIEEPIFWKGTRQ